MSEQKAPTIREALQAGARKLGEAGIDTAALDMSLLIAEAIGLDRMGVYLNFDRPLDQIERKKIRVLFDRRMRREPMAYILGRREFYGLRFEVNPAVLIPRPETEHLVQAAVEWIQNVAADARGKLKFELRTGIPTPVVADIGTGSGAIAVAVAHAVAGCRVIATDVSNEALETARRNAEKHGVADRIEFRAGNLFGPIREKVDAILSNPPYVAEIDRESMAPDVVEYEPAGALFSGADGLDCIRELVKQAPEHLRSGGLMLIEIGAGQAMGVESIIAKTGAFEGIEFVKDYAGIERVAKAMRV